MVAERTIAIIGEKGAFCPALAEKLAKQNLHLLFISNDEEQNVKIQKQLEKKDHAAKIEFINCEKEGCWEADIIAFTHPGNIEPEMIKRIKDVATQKIVLTISEEKSTRLNDSSGNLEEFLPHSRVVNLVIDQENLKVVMSGKDHEAQEIVKDFFEKAGYKV